MPREAKSAEYELMGDLLEAYWDTWRAKAGVNEPMLYSRISVLALSQVGACIAVDVGMQLEQFLAINKANFEEAYKRAPKFA